MRRNELACGRERALPRQRREPRVRWRYELGEFSAGVGDWFAVRVHGCARGPLAQHAAFVGAEQLRAGGQLAHRECSRELQVHAQRAKPHARLELRAHRHAERGVGEHGERLARHFGIRATSSLSVGRARLAPLVLTRLQGQVAPGAVTAPLKPEAAFIEDLNADSLDLVEFAMGLEEKFGVTIADEELGKIKTVQDAVDAIVEKKG